MSTNGFGSLFAVEKNSGSGKRSVIFTYGDFFPFSFFAVVINGVKLSASKECVVTYALNRLGKSEGEKILAVKESVFADCNGFAEDGYGGNSGAACKCVSLNVSLSGNGYGNKGGGNCAEDVTESCLLVFSGNRLTDKGKGDGLEIGKSCKCISFNGNYGVGKGD